MNDWEREALSRLRNWFDDYKKGRITKEDLVQKLFEEAAVHGEEQWRILENLRTQAPEPERELARQVADLLEAELRKGSGNA
jgi:hypothetical protein